MARSPVQVTLAFVLLHLLGLALAGPPPLDRAALEKAFAASIKRLFCLDIDGTLMPETRGASHEPVIKALQELSASPKNVVWIVTARPLRGLDLYGLTTQALPKVGVVAEYGAQVRKPGSNKWEQGLVPHGKAPVTKGDSVKWLLKQNKPVPFALAAGDQWPDELMFKVLNDNKKKTYFSVHVGGDPGKDADMDTIAKGYVDAPKDMLATLAALKD